MAIITGGDRGTGRAIALAFPRADLDAVVISRRANQVEEVAALGQRLTRNGQRAVVIYRRQVGKNYEIQN